MKLLYDSGAVLAGAIVSLTLLFAYYNLAEHYHEAEHSHEEENGCQCISTQSQ